MIAQKLGKDLMPDYHIPLSLRLRIGWSLISGSPRSVLADSLSVFADGRPVFKILGEENIPSEDPCLIVCNHYYRPGFDAWWIALGVSAAFEGKREDWVDQDIRWVMTSAWTFPDKLLRAKLLTPLTRILFGRLARIYEFVSMPPMPPAPHEVQGRAIAVLRTIRLARERKENGVLIGLAPEGRDFWMEEGSPPEGVGKFIALLVRTGLKILPVGVYENDGALVVSFGELFVPEIPEEKSDRDRELTVQVMAEINAQIPELKIAV